MLRCTAHALPVLTSAGARKRDFVHLTMFPLYSQRERWERSTPEARGAVGRPGGRTRTCL